MKYPKIQPSKPQINPYSATSVPKELRTAIKKRAYHRHKQNFNHFTPGWSNVARCGANKSRNRGLCRGVAIRGTNRCRCHGGGQRQLAIIKREALAMEREEQEAANRMVQSVTGDKALYPSDVVGSPKYKLDKSTSKLAHFKRIHPSILDLREELAILQTELQKTLNSDEKNTRPCPNCGEVIEQKARKTNAILRIVAGIKDIVRVIHDIEEGRKVLITRESLQVQLVKIVKIVKKYIPDEGMRQQMANEIREVSVS